MTSSKIANYQFIDKILMRLLLVALFVSVLTIPAALSAPINVTPNWRSYTQTGNPADIVSSTEVARAIGAKIDAENGQAQGLRRNGGSDTGTDISAAYVSDTFSLSKYLSSASTNRFTVYLGAVIGMGQLANDVQQSLKAGNITLFEHGMGVNPAYLSDSERAAVQAAWAKAGVDITSGTGGTGMAELGCCSIDAAGYTGFGGKVPALATVNLPDTSGAGGDGAAMTDEGEASNEKQITAFYAYPNMSKNIAPVMRPDPTQPTKLWDTDDLYAPNRKLALFTGGVAIDMPPTLAESQSTAALDNYANEIAWAIKNHLRATLVLSPYVLGQGGCVFDPNLVENTKAFVSYLLSKAPPPTEYVIENYCGDKGSTVNSPSGDSVPESLNQAALYLSTLPVSPAATATPQIAGALSEVDAISEGNLYSDARSTELTIETPLATANNDPIPLSDIRSIIDNRINTLGSMAYQSNASVNIQGGNINGVNSPLDITICPSCTLLMQTHMTFQATNGNVDVQGSKTDPTLDIYNPYTSAAPGITLGLPEDTLAPKMLLGTGAGMSYQEGMLFQSHNEVVLGLFSSHGFSNIGVSSTGLTTFTNPASDADYATGLEFAPPGLVVSSRPSISVTNNGTVMKVVAPTVNFSGAVTLNGVTDTTLTGTGTAYACLTAAGKLYRSAAACN